MLGPHEPPSEGDGPNRIFDGAFRLVVVLAAVMVMLMLVRVLGDANAPGAGTRSAASDGAGGWAGQAATASPGPSLDIDAYLESFVRPAPPLELTGPAGQPLSLADFIGVPVLVFFGYTHCPDVCPVTIGAVGETIDAYGGDAQAIFVSVDPERDTVPWLGEFVRYMPAGFTAATGTPAEVRATADAWGVRYARVEEADPGAYSMSHTADVFVVDAAGQFRARLPFGTKVPTMVAVMREIAATTALPTATRGLTPSPAPPSVAPSPPADAEPTGAIRPEVVSSSVWAGGASPVILTLHDASGGVDDVRWRVTAQLVRGDGVAVGGPVEAVVVQPSGMTAVSFVVSLDIPMPGPWRLTVVAVDPTGAIHRGTVDLVVLEPGGTAALGAPAPTARTLTPADVGDDLTWLTTDPLPDPRLSQTSTADALAAGTPFVLVVDSVAFRVTPACGKAVVLAKRLLDRWRDIPFIHHEPYRYDVITTEPVLQGTLADPRLTEVADAWGVGAAPWGVGSMPWIFIVDGDGIVRSKYQGVIGSADVDVILSLLALEG